MIVPEEEETKPDAATDAKLPEEKLENEAHNPDSKGIIQVCYPTLPYPTLP